MTNAYCLARNNTIFHYHMHTYYYIASNACVDGSLVYHTGYISLFISGHIESDRTGSHIHFYDY